METIRTIQNGHTQPQQTEARGECTFLLKLIALAAWKQGISSIPVMHSDECNSPLQRSVIADSLFG